MHEAGLFDFNPINHPLNQLKQSHDEYTQGLTTNRLHLCQAPKLLYFSQLVKVVSGLKAVLPVNISPVAYGFRSQAQYHLVQG